MSFNRMQFENLIRRVLTEADPALCTDAAVNLLLGTAAQESHFGTYLKQLKGPAVGVFQMEPATFDWLKEKYKKDFPHVVQCDASDMEWDLALSVLFARLRYRVIPTALPDADNVPALAAYWKAYYNTAAGAGTVKEFLNNYECFVA